MRKSTVEEFLIDKIIKRRNVSRNTAKKLYKNSLIYNIVQEAILDQIDFLITNNIELLK